MSNYFEYKDKVAFHPGYYIKEYVDEYDLTQEDFAKRLDTTPKNLSCLIRGEQELSLDLAIKLSRFTGTSVEYWLNLQKSYDLLIAEFKSDKELGVERQVFTFLEYSYFREHFGLPDHIRNIDAQIEELRKFLGIASLNALVKQDLAVSFRNSQSELSTKNRVRANALVQTAVNAAMKKNAPKYDRKAFGRAVEYALTLTEKHETFYDLISKRFLDAGVSFVVMPAMSGSKTNGATKKIGDSIMLMVTDRNLYSDVFWFSLFHEIGHVINGDYGISTDKESGEKEDLADRFASEKLIPSGLYFTFLNREKYDIGSIIEFARKINRDPGIVVGRLLHDNKLQYMDSNVLALRKKYKVV